MSLETTLDAGAGAPGAEVGIGAAVVPDEGEFLFFDEGAGGAGHVEL